MENEETKKTSLSCFFIIYLVKQLKEKMDVSYWTNPKDVILSNVDCKFKTNK